MWSAVEVRDHAGPEIIDKVERGEFSHCRSPGTFRSDACLAGQSSETRRTDDAEETRNRCGQSPALAIGTAGSWPSASAWALWPWSSPCWLLRPPQGQRWPAMPPSNHRCDYLGGDECLCVRLACGWLADFPDDRPWFRRAGFVYALTKTGAIMLFARGLQ